MDTSVFCFCFARYRMRINSPEWDRDVCRLDHPSNINVGYFV